MPFNRVKDALKTGRLFIIEPVGYAFAERLVTLGNDIDRHQ